MCDATALMAAGAVITTGSSILSAVNQQKQSDLNKQSAQDSFRAEMSALGQRVAQTQDANSYNVFEADRRARQAHAVASVSAGEAGVSGASVDMILSGIDRERLDFEQAAQKNLQMQTDQLQNEKLASQARLKSRLAAVPPPNPFATALQIGGAGLQFGTDYLKNQPVPGRIGKNGGE